MTRSGVLVALGSLASLVAARILGLPELAVLGTVGLALVVLALAQVRRPLGALEVERSLHPERVQRGGPSRVELQIANRGRRRSPVLTLHDPVEGTVGAKMSLPPLRPDERHTAGYRLPTERRGLVRIGPLDTQVGDAFGLARRRRPTTAAATLTVLPAIDPLTGPTGGGSLDDPLAGIAHPVLGSSGDEDFATLRPYVVGDDLRRVHWPSSARAGDLLVRQDDPPWQGRVTVVLDGREDRLGPERFEVAVSAAASVLHAVGQRGDRARLVITDGTDTGLVDARAGRDMLLEHLALVGRHRADRLPEVPVDGRSRTGSLVVVTGSPDQAEVERLQALRDRFASIRLVVVDPSAVGGAPVAAPSAGLGVDVVRVAAGTPFPAAWASPSRAAERR